MQLLKIARIVSNSKLICLVLRNPNNQRTLEIDKKIDDGKKFHKKLHYLAQSHNVKSSGHSQESKSFVLPNAVNHNGESRLSPLRKDRRFEKYSKQKNMPVDHYNTNVGFGTKTKIMQRMSGEKRKKLLYDLKNSQIAHNDKTKTTGTFHQISNRK